MAKYSAEQADGSLGSDSDGDESSRMDITYTRSYPLEDITVRSEGDGRTVDAYAAVFDTPAEIHDQDGDYFEVLDPTCFDRAIQFGRRAKGGWNIPVMFNHGMTIFHTPSAQDSMPIGVPEEIRADSRGLFTRTRYHDTPRANEALEAIREGSITAYSFAGKFHRSQPAAQGKYRAGRDGTLPTVRRMASTLREYGPTPFPAYVGAEVVGVRAEQAAFMLGSLSGDERERLVALLSGTPDPGPATDQDDPPDVGHSTRSPKEELQARRAEFIIRHGGLNA